MRFLHLHIPFIELGEEELEGFLDSSSEGRGKLEARGEGGRLNS